MTDQPPSVADLYAQLRAAEATAADAASQTGDATLIRERSLARSFATRAIVAAYVGILVLVVLFICASGIISGDYHSAVSEVIDLIKTALIPVVTFVIGHYFGSSQS